MGETDMELKEVIAEITMAEVHVGEGEDAEIDPVVLWNALHFFEKLKTDLDVTKKNLERRNLEVGWMVDRCDRQEKVIKVIEWSGEFGLCVLCDQVEDKGHAPDCPFDGLKPRGTEEAK